MSERFLEAALRPWIDSNKNFVNKKKLFGYIPFRDYKTDFWQSSTWPCYGLWSFQNEFQLVSHIHNTIKLKNSLFPH